MSGKPFEFKESKSCWEEDMKQDNVERCIWKWGPGNTKLVKVELIDQLIPMIPTERCKVSRKDIIDIQREACSKPKQQGPNGSTHRVARKVGEKRFIYVVPDW